MALAEISEKNSIITGLKVADKLDLLDNLAGLAHRATGAPHELIYKLLVERENLSSTGTGSGGAIPHARIAGVERTHIFFARLDSPVDFNALDQKPVDIIFMIIAPEKASADYLKTLAGISRIFRNKELVIKLRATEDAEELMQIILKHCG